MRKEITNKQKVVLSTISDLTAKLGKAPTLEEIRKSLNYSKISSVQRHVDALRKKDILRRDTNRGRSLKINLTSNDTVQIPLVGNVACGTPFLATENIEAYIPYSKSNLLGDPEGYFFLRAVGDSMNRADINDGDYVLVKKEQTADPGQRIVALIGEEATIKKLKKGDGHYILEPESTNSANKPIYIFHDILIQGVVKDVIPKGGES